MQKYNFKFLKFLVVIPMLLILAGCNEEELFEKEYLDGLGVFNENSPTPGPNVTPMPTPNPNHIIDNFIQNGAEVNANIDILWVIDNSGSMGNEQQDLADNFQTFINGFIQEDINYRMAVTTTDPTQAVVGQHACDWNLLTKTAADNDELKFIRDFQDCIKVGTTGSGNEQGMVASSAFLNLNATQFLRPEAYLIIVYVSDEEEHGPLTAQGYVDQATAFKNNAGLVKTYSIVNTVTTGSGHEEIGQKYIDGSLITGGTSSDIHQDFHETLLDIGVRILDLADSFPLSEVPVENTIMVIVNGTNVPTGWGYDPVARTIRFDVNNVPAVNSNISIQYEVTGI